MIGWSDTIFFPFFLVAVFWYCFLITSAVIKVKSVGQSLLAALIMLYQLKLRTEDKFLFFS